MLTTQDAHKVLGVREGATKEEILKRYNVLLRKYRASQNTESSDTDDGISMDEITQAYNLLMGYVTEEDFKEEPSTPNPILQSIGVDEKKARNFFYYYKIHIIVAIVAVIAIVFTVKDLVTRVDPDFNITFMGPFYSADTANFQKNVKAGMPDIKAAGVDMIPLANSDQADQQQYAYQMKAVAILAAGDVDVFILDKSNFERYGKGGAFENLDDLAAKLNLDKNKTDNYKLKTQDSSQEHIYGIDVSSSPIFKDSQIEGKGFIAAIGVKAKHSDKAEEFIKLLLKQP